MMARATARPLIPRSTWLAQADVLDRVHDETMSGITSDMLTMHMADSQDAPGFKRPRSVGHASPSTSPLTSRAVAACLATRAVGEEHRVMCRARTAHRRSPLGLHSLSARRPSREDEDEDPELAGLPNDDTDSSFSSRGSASPIESAGCWRMSSRPHAAAFVIAQAMLDDETTMVRATHDHTRFRVQTRRPRRRTVHDRLLCARGVRGSTGAIYPPSRSGPLNVGITSACVIV
jgi:hypothetical protein